MPDDKTRQDKTIEERRQEGFSKRYLRRGGVHQQEKLATGGLFLGQGGLYVGKVNHTKPQLLHDAMSHPAGHDSILHSLGVGFGEKIGGDGGSIPAFAPSVQHSAVLHQLHSCLQQLLGGVSLAELRAHTYVGQ